MESPEYTRFQEFYHLLSTGISHPESLAGLLWANKFIGITERTDAQHIQTPPHLRTIALLNSVSKKIQVDPDMFQRFVLILQQDPSLKFLAAKMSQEALPATPTPNNRVSTVDFSEAEMLKWLKKIGLKDTDEQLLIDEGFGTGPGFMELTKEDIDEMNFSRAGKKLLTKTISSGGQPVAIETVPLPITVAPMEVNGATATPFPTYNQPVFKESLTADGLAAEFGVQTYALDNEFSDNFSIILAFAKLITHWQPLASCLGLSPQDIRGIETNINLNFQMQCTEVLKRWKMRYAFKATYRMLIEAVLANDGWDNIARQYVGFVKKIFGSAPSQTRAPVTAAPPESVTVPLSLPFLIDALSPLLLTKSINGQLSRGLGIPDYKLIEFESNNTTDIARVRNDILRYWLQQEERPSWQVVGNAVWRAGDMNLARKILAYKVPED